ncbi:MAG: hypothetical protein P8N19_07865 [Flavobacteriales bacterium]|nr:hypothetical protein [Flavobacteriales bacterium]MDG1765839.1 hypothetical protein [Flavobacteriales bacterium]
MNHFVSIEISLYPLHQAYEQAVLKFIAELEQAPDVKIVTNGMSTQVYGPIDTLMPLIQEGMKSTWNDGEQSVFVMKFLKGDVSSYEHQPTA